eukprot:5655081-Prymnesium_polylepis.1
MSYRDTRHCTHDDRTWLTSICGCPEWGFVERCKGMTSGHAGRTPGRTLPSRWARPCIRQRCPGRRLNPSTAHHIL